MMPAFVLADPNEFGTSNQRDALQARRFLD